VRAFKEADGYGVVVVIVPSPSSSTKRYAEHRFDHPRGNARGIAKADLIS
jgi:hypothetical protein